MSKLLLNSTKIKENKIFLKNVFKKKSDNEKFWI